MKKNIIKYVVSSVIILLIYIVFREMFIERSWSESIHFLKLIHYENRSDLLTFINIIVSTLISYNVYVLSKRINEQNNIEKEKIKYESICLVHDYLNEVILYTKKFVFKDKENYQYLDYNEDFMKCVYNIGKDVLDDNDIELIRKINQNLKNFVRRDKAEKTEKLVVKWLYKDLFDVNMSILQIEDFNNIVDIDLLLNPQLVLIISKLRKILGYTYCKNIEYENVELTIKLKKNKINVKKKYCDGFYIDNGTGKVKIYEPIFYAGEPFFRNGAVIYEGMINNYLPEGYGIYYYYKSCEEKEIYLDSYNMVDKTAERIKKILLKENIKKENNLKVDGYFYGGKILEGTIFFEDEKINNINLKENTYE